MKHDEGRLISEPGYDCPETCPSCGNDGEFVSTCHADYESESAGYACPHCKCEWSWVWECVGHERRIIGESPRIYPPLAENKTTNSELAQAENYTPKPPASCEPRLRTGKPLILVSIDEEDIQAQFEEMTDNQATRFLAFLHKQSFSGLNYSEYIWDSLTVYHEDWKATTTTT